MSYEKRTWKNYPDTSTPITAEYLNHIEDGLFSVTNDLTNNYYTKDETPKYTAGENITISSDNVISATGGDVDPNIYASNHIQLGTGASATGNYSIANGTSVYAVGNNSHAEGSNTHANNVGSHAEGTYTYAYGEYSHAEGNSCSTGSASSTSKGKYAHAEGMGTNAEGESSHAEGVNTKASGMYSHAEGSNTKATAAISHAEGYGTIASSENQHVEGRYNIEDSDKVYAHIVGNGSNTTKSNAHTLDWEGNAWFAGKVEATNLTPLTLYKSNTTVSDGTMTYTPLYIDSDKTEEFFDREALIDAFKEGRLTLEVGGALSKPNFVVPQMFSSGNVTYYMVRGIYAGQSSGYESYNITCKGVKNS